MGFATSQFAGLGSMSFLRSSAFMKTVFRASLLALFAGYWIAGFAQPYPVRLVKLLVGYPAGGGMDAIARIVGQKLSDRLGQQVVVENRPGAAGTLAADATAKSLPDGYTLYFAETGFLISPSMMANLPVDPVKSFTPVALVCVLPLAIVVEPNFPANNTHELIEALKANPGKYSYGSAGIGTVHHFAFELFMRAKGLRVMHVPYRGGAPMIPDLISGRIPIGVLSIPIAAGLVKDKKIRAIAVTSAQRVPSVADWPPLGDTLAGFDAAPRLFILAPADTPAAVVVRLNEAIQYVLALREVQDNFARQGAVPAFATPEALQASIASEVKRWGAIARDAGIKPE